MSIDPEDQEADRRRMLTYLARYGRQSLREADWWDEDLEELRAKFADLSEVLKAESAVGRAEEDR